VVEPEHGGRHRRGTKAAVRCPRRIDILVEQRRQSPAGNGRDVGARPWRWWRRVRPMLNLLFRAFPSRLPVRFVPQMLLGLRAHRHIRRSPQGRQPKRHRTTAQSKAGLIAQKKKNEKKNTKSLPRSCHPKGVAARQCGDAAAAEELCDLRLDDAAAQRFNGADKSRWGPALFCMSDEAGPP